MICLLCQRFSPLPLRITDILFLKPQTATLCQECQQGFQKISFTSCQTCNASSQSSPCSDCLEWKVKGYEVNHRSLYQYNAAMKAYFSQYKFQGDYLLRHVFAQELAQVIKKTIQILLLFQFLSVRSVMKNVVSIK